MVMKQNFKFDQKKSRHRTVREAQGRVVTYKVPRSEMRAMMYLLDHAPYAWALELRAMRFAGVKVAEAAVVPVEDHVAAAGNFAANTNFGDNSNSGDKTPTTKI